MNGPFRWSLLTAIISGLALLTACKDTSHEPIRFDKLKITKDEITAIDAGQLTINNTYGPAFVFHGRSNKYYVFSASIRDSGDDVTDMVRLVQQVSQLQSANDCSIVVHLLTNTYYDSSFSDSRRYLFFTASQRGTAPFDFAHAGTEAGFASPQLTNPILFWIDDLHRTPPPPEFKLSHHFDIRLPFTIVERTDFHRYVPPHWP